MWIEHTLTKKERAEIESILELLLSHDRESQLLGLEFSDKYKDCYVEHHWFNPEWISLHFSLSTAMFLRDLLNHNQYYKRNELHT